MNQINSVLLTDLYELTMLEAWFTEGANDIASFEFFVRALPSSRNFLMAAGLEQVIQLPGDAAFRRCRSGNA